MQSPGLVVFEEAFVQEVVGSNPSTGDWKVHTKNNNFRSITVRLTCLFCLDLAALLMWN